VRKLFAATILLALGCGSVQQERFVLDLKTQSDDGQPLAGVVVYFKDRPMGESASAGELQLVVAAVTGQSLPLRFDCPKGFVAARDGVRVPLRTSGDNRYQVVLDCKPEKRKALIAIATNMANIPLFLGAEQVGVTNEFGVAHLAVARAEQDDFEIKMDTSSVPLLRPSSPVFQFKMPDHDESFIVQESFVLEEPPPPPPPAPKKKVKKKVVVKKKRPTRLEGLEKDFGTLRK